MSANGWRWAAALAIAAVGGLVDVSTDAKFPGWWDICRHMLIEVGTVIPALKMTLTPTK